MAGSLKAPEAQAGYSPAYPARTLHLACSSARCPVRICVGSCRLQKGGDGGRDLEGHYGGGLRQAQIQNPQLGIADGLRGGAELQLRTPPQPLLSSWASSSSGCVPPPTRFLLQPASWQTAQLEAWLGTRPEALKSGSRHTAGANLISRTARDAKEAWHGTTSRDENPADGTWSVSVRFRLRCVQTGRRRCPGRGCRSARASSGIHFQQHLTGAAASALCSRTTKSPAIPSPNECIC